MSYSIRAKFCRKNKKTNEWEIALDCWCDILKNLNDRSYDYHMNDIDEVYGIDDETTKQISKYLGEEFVGVLNPKHKKLVASYLNGNDHDKNKSECVKIPFDISDELKNEIISKCEKIDYHSNKSYEDYINVYDEVVKYENGSWYNCSSFMNAKIKYENELKEFVDKKYKLNSIKDSVEYFKLNNEQKDGLLQEISWNDESITDIRYKISSCEYMMNLCDVVTNLADKSIFDYDWNNVMIFISCS